MSLDFGLKDKLVLVTGSTEGIGRGIASRFLELGAHVIINGRNKEKTLKAAADLEVVAAKTNSRVYAASADLGSSEGVRQLAEEVQKIGNVDILVNNAGIGEFKDFFEITDEQWNKYWSTNVMSGVGLSRVFLKGMLERNSGSIIFISSLVAFKPVPNMIHYSTTKAAQVNIARGLAELAKGTAVRIHSLLPGPTLTEGLGPLFEETAKSQGTTFEEAKKSFITSSFPTSLIQRMVDPIDIANFAVFLASPLSAATTGSSHRADGGIIQYL